MDFEAAQGLQGFNISRHASCKDLLEGGQKETRNQTRFVSVVWQDLATHISAEWETVCIQGIAQCRQHLNIPAADSEEQSLNLGSVSRKQNFATHQLSSTNQRHRPSEKGTVLASGEYHYR